MGNVNTKRTAITSSSPVPWLGEALQRFRRIMSKRRGWIGALISSACLFLALRRVSWAEVASSLHGADYRLLALAMIMQAAAVSSAALRWKVLFYPKWGLRTGKFVSVAFIGELANSLLPARIGSLVRIYLIGQMEQVSRAFALGTIVAEKAADGVMLAVSCLLLVPLIALPVWVLRASLLSAGVLLVVVVGLTMPTSSRRVILIIFERISGLVPVVISWRVPDAVRSSLDGIQAFLRREVVLPIWGWSVVMWGLGALINFIMLRVVGLPAGPVAALSLLVILQIGTKVPSLPAGIGVFEYLCVFTLSLFGIAGSQALTFGILLHFVVVVPPSVIGTIMLWRQDWDSIIFSPGRLRAALTVDPVEPDGRA